MTTPPASDDPLVLVHAYVDGELDPANALALERHMAAEPALAAERDRIMALRQAIKERLPREPLPPGLPARIERAAGLWPAIPPPTWRALAASVLLTAMVASGATFVAIAPEGPGVADAAEHAVVAGHIRGLMAPQPVDVASSDRHTVKPWFHGRIPEAPRVVDLAAAGFSLVGGRLDVVGQKPVPTLVYRVRGHLISVTAVPRELAASAQPGRGEAAGYNVLQWSDGGIAYWAISDLAMAELTQFAQLFRTAQPDP